MSLIATGLIALLVAAVPTGISVVSLRHKNDADAELTVGAAYSQILKELRVELDRRDADCNRRIQRVRDDLMADILFLRDLVIQLGGNPSVIQGTTYQTTHTTTMVTPPDLVDDTKSGGGPDVG